MKACIACKHFELNIGEAGIYGRTGDVVCNAGNFNIWGPDDNAVQVMIEKGINCPDFEVSALAISKGWPV